MTKTLKAIKLSLVMAVVGAVVLAAGWLFSLSTQPKASAAVCLDTDQAQIDCTPRDNQIPTEIDQTPEESQKDPESPNTDPQAEDPQVLGASTTAGTFTGK